MNDTLLDLTHFFRQFANLNGSNNITEIRNYNIQWHNKPITVIKCKNGECNTIRIGGSTISTYLDQPIIPSILVHRNGDHRNIYYTPMQLTNGDIGNNYPVSIDFNVAYKLTEQLTERLQTGNLKLLVEQFLNVKMIFLRMKCKSGVTEWYGILLAIQRNHFYYYFSS